MKKIIVVATVFFFAHLALALNDAASARVVAIQNHVPFKAAYPLTQATTINVKSAHGKIHLLPADDSFLTIEVFATGFARNANVKIEGPQNGKFKLELVNSETDENNATSGIRINSRYGFLLPQLHIIVRVPEEFLLHAQLKTSNGSIIAKGFSQPLMGRHMVLITDNAAIEIADLATAGDGMISVKTSNGYIYARQCEGNLLLNTSHAKITALENSNGNLWAKTSNANIAIANHVGGAVSASTSDASIKFSNPDAQSESGTTTNGQVFYTQRS